MQFVNTPLQGAYVIHLEPRGDKRGDFARAFCETEFLARGLNPRVAQCNLARSLKKGTLRGLHYQRPPAAEAKLIRCVAGAIFDVIVDLRADSPTYLQHFSITLSAENRLAIYVPENFAHGYQTLEDASEIYYQVSEKYTPGAEDGLRYDDPVLSVHWPLPPSEISQKDLSWNLLEASENRR